MDLQTSLLCLGIVIVSTVIIWFILTVSTRGQSYEEVVAESRRLAAQRGFFDDPSKAKKKQQQTKKDKKAGKKVKEKQAKEQQVATSNSEADSDGLVESSPEEEPHPAKPPHVEFVEEPPQVLPDVTHKNNNKSKSKKGKEPKVKPILINKDDPSCISDVSNPPSPTVTEINHFEQIHPKDEFELLHSHEKEGKDKKDGKGSKQKVAKGKQQQETQKEAPKPKDVEPIPAAKVEPPKQAEVKEQKKGKKSVEKSEAASENVSVSSSCNISQPGNMTTDKILKQVYPLETAAPAPPAMATGDAPTTNGPTHPQGKKKKNIQLHQLTMGGDGINVNLLVKLLSDSSLSRSEIQILTDCLLNKQNGPLPEHSEWSEGPKDPMQKLKKQLAEKEKALTDEQEAHQALNAKLKELRSTLNSERGKVSQLLASTEESSVNHRNDMAMAQARIQRAVDESNMLRQQLLQVQSKLNAEADFSTQRSQMEMHIQALSEAKASLASALGALQAEMADLRAAHSGVSSELHMAREQLMATQHHSQEMSRQMEELTRRNNELETQIMNAVSSEQFIKQELHQANQRLKGFGEAQAEIQRLSSMHTHTQKLALQHEKKHEELEKQNQQLSSEMTKLKSEKEELSHLVEELKDKVATQSTPNGTTTPIKEDSVSVEKAVAAACRELEAKHSQQIDSLQRQLDQHRDKNNDLRTKNWKVMDALQAAEKKVQELEKGASKGKDTSDSISETRLAEQKNTKDILHRLFPNISASGSSHDEWLQNFASKVQEQVSAAKSLSVSNANATPSSGDSQKADSKVMELEKQNSQLQTLVDKYKKVIDDTEGVLSRLQNNVTEEEKRWAKQLNEKQQELDNLKNHSITQLKDKIDSLQDAYEREHELRLELEQRGKSGGENNAFMSAIASKGYSHLPDIERLKEENARLTELVERLHHNGPSQLPSFSTLEQKPTKKRRSISGWFRRKITFRRKKHKENKVAELERRKSFGDESKENDKNEESSTFPHYENKTL